METGGCWARGDADESEHGADRHNVEVAKLIDGLGQFGAGRRAILKAVAARLGLLTMTSWRSSMQATPPGNFEFRDRCDKRLSRLAWVTIGGSDYLDACRSTGDPC